MLERVTPEQLERLQARTLEIQEKLGERWTLRGPRMGSWMLQWDLQWEGAFPEIDPTNKYLTQNYDCCSASYPGLVKVDSYIEGYNFLSLLEAWSILTPDKLPDIEKILGVHKMVLFDGHASAAYTYSDEYDPESLPCEVDGSLYWMEDINRVFRYADLITTADWCTIYGSYSAIPLPEEPALLLRIFGDTGGESEVELEYVFEHFEIEPGSLEHLLALQLLCHQEGRYAYVRYDLIAAVWLAAVPGNLEYFEAAIEQDDFKRYYNTCRWQDQESERDTAIREWLEAIIEYIETDRRPQDFEEELEKAKVWLDQLKDELV
jgi:hypothetical protein